MTMVQSDNSNIIHLTEYHTPCGALLLGSCSGRLCLCDWKYRRDREGVDKRLARYLGGESQHASTDFLHEVIQQIDEYFEGTRVEFDIPLLMVGTDFQKLVWHQLRSIPSGRTLSYTEIAHSIGRPSSVRAVANAIGANALSILVPCHRVVGTDGTLTGYAGGLEAKRFLLELESHHQAL